MENTSGKLLFMHGDGQSNMHIVYAFGQVLKELANVTSDDVVTSEMLLLCGPFSKIVNAKISPGWMCRLLQFAVYVFQ